MIEWTESYNVHRAVLGKLIAIVISWTKDGYKISLTGYSSITLKQPVKEIEEAKHQALAFAKRKIKEMTAELE